MSYGFGYLNDLSERVGKWAVTVFTRATPQSICEHLRREVIELTEHPDDVEEAADCILLLLHLAYRQGWNLEQAIINKHEKNQQRSWGLPDAQGVVEHIPFGAAPQKNYCGDCPDRTGPCACDPTPQTAAVSEPKKRRRIFNAEDVSIPVLDEVAPGPQEGREIDWSDDEAVVRAAHPDTPAEVGYERNWAEIRRALPSVQAFECKYRAVPDSTPVEKGEV